MRRIRYQVACSLDGYIAGPKGEFDWIIMDPAIDFGELFSQFDTLLMGRTTYEAAMKAGVSFPGMSVYVFSRTLKQQDHPGATIVAEDIPTTIAALRARPGKDIWLYGGGELFRTLLDLGCVDTVEPAVIPVLLGGGTPFLPAAAQQTKLSLTRHHVYPTGIVLLEYAVQRPAAATRRRSRKKSARPA